MFRKSICISFLFACFILSSCGDESPGGTITPPKDTTAIVDPGNNVQDTFVNPPQDLATQIDIPLIDTNVPPTRMQRACGIKNTGTGSKLLGDMCTAHEECSTGYCYDEWYLSWGGGFRFCTIACNGCDGVFNSCDDYNNQSPGRELKCNIISNGCTQGVYPGHEVRGFCVPSCVDIGQCIEAYGAGSYTSCQQSKIDECGSFGTPNKVCFVPKN